MNSVALVMKPEDNVATAISELVKDQKIEIPMGDTVRTIELNEDIPFGFKLSLVRIAKGSKILKYGETIGLASEDIEPGMVVHVHNVEGARGRGNL